MKKPPKKIWIISDGACGTQLDALAFTSRKAATEARRAENERINAIATYCEPVAYVRAEADAVRLATIEEACRRVRDTSCSSSELREHMLAWSAQQRVSR